MNRNRFVITVTRQFGSMGRPIAMKLAETLGIEYYDRDIVEKTAEKLNLPSAIVDEMEEKARHEYVNPYMRMKYPLGRQSTSAQQDQIFETQKNIIAFLAEQHSCVIIGRCADFILADHPDSMHIYIYAPYVCRLRHCTQDLGLSEEEGKKMIHDVDLARQAYHERYAGCLPGDPKYKDILINSAFLGTERTVEYLARLAEIRFGL